MKTQFPVVDNSDYEKEGYIIPNNDLHYTCKHCGKEEYQAAHIVQKIDGYYCFKCAYK